MTATSAQAPRSDVSRSHAVPADDAGQKAAKRSPLAQLLHALNQPLTGLQCSMEVALGRPRTNEQYAEGLRQGLELTGRMRALVEAIREVAEVEEDDEEGRVQLTETTALAGLLREAVNELRPVAEAKNVRLALEMRMEKNGAETELAIAGKQPALAQVIFRLLDSTLSMAAPGTALRIEAGSRAGPAEIRIEWQAQGPRSAFSRPELGLLIAQARLERWGAEWERAAAGDNSNNNNLETLNIRLPRVSQVAGER
jgi:signal transduction histidine kinase